MHIECFVKLPHCFINMYCFLVPSCLPINIHHTHSLLPFLQALWFYPYFLLLPVVKLFLNNTNMHCRSLCQKDVQPEPQDGEIQELSYLRATRAWLRYLGLNRKKQELKPQKFTGRNRWDISGDRRQIQKQQKKRLATQETPRPAIMTGLSWDKQPVSLEHSRRWQSQRRKCERGVPKLWDVVLSQRWKKNAEKCRQREHRTTSDIAGARVQTPIWDSATGCRFYNK